MHDTDARLWHPWLRINRVLRVMLTTRWTQFGDVVAECGVPGGEVVAHCPGLARWRRTPWDTGEGRIKRTRLPPAIPTEVLMRLIWLAVVLTLRLYKSLLAGEARICVARRLI